MADVVCYGALEWLVTLGAAETLYGHWGTGSTPASRSQGALINPTTDEEAVSINPTTDSIGVSGYDDTIVCAFTMVCKTSPKTICEAGVYDDTPVLLFRSQFTGYPVEVDDEITFIFRWRLK